MTNFDFAMLNFIQELRTPLGDIIFSFITSLGNGGMLWILIGVVLLCLKKYRKTGICVFASLVLSSIIFTLIVKNVVARERPFNNDLGILGAADLIIGLPGDRYSFPSGHTLTSFTAATSIVLRNKVLGIICMIIATAIAFSRLYMYVHFPSDVVFGAIFGILVALVVNKLEKKLSIRIGQGNRKN